ncbi:restriction endonuclease subunit S [Klebsiella pneumoniae]|uniref:restriction endonuclease subunit S n=1 Tax=Klebsiella pneumoniae TaxID=573 RepID=UPI000E2BE631|nr:restriction endonuclease subunit S [Klebsiella pneumoniae]HBY0413827.1 restriction endonuclease subunit S [Klebsiella pneumoniae subsp. pneumoniae]MCM5924993.1 restriction endonuclease subunit S [Klebsiella pneumoniae]SVU01804.1 Restriction modification system DNA specificity domain protein [Klebsiella pneumoniae]HBS7669608.1 restriction endonuclease subunit S [Klebsiella pneumoniae]HBZ2549698.1 restriction endonuclease subunit S [Klebsiella pneumoniae]
MSELSYLEKLLDGVEVEWVTLGSMADIGTGNSNRQDESENGIYPFYVRSKNILKSDTFEFDEVAIVIPGEGGIGDIFHYVEGKYALHQRAYRIRITTNAVDTKFLYYFMSSSFKQYILTKSVGATAISIRKPMLEGFKVPIPSPDNPEKSLAIQSEIVRILDKFTALTAELTAELTARKKQYNYYRDQLLSFKEGEVEWKTLGEVATFRRGTAITQKQTTPGDIPVVANGPTPTYFHSESNRQDETIVIARSGAYAGYVSFWNQPIFLTDAFSVHPNLKIVKPKFLYYVLQNKQEHIHAMKKGAGVPHVRVKEFESYDVPIPPLAEQVRIVTILDKFDTLTNSITEGLPREIELRQKQYEYYRDMLFSFPKPDVVEA